MGLTVNSGLTTNRIELMEKSTLDYIEYLNRSRLNIILLET